MNGLINDKMLRYEVPQLATFLWAYRECDKEVQEIVDCMAAIITDEESTPEEIAVATDTFIEALWPGKIVDVLEADEKLVSHDTYKKAASIGESEEEAFVDRVKAVMAKNDMNQEGLAKATGVTQPAISNILNRNCRPRRATIAKLAEALDVTVEELWPENS